MRLGSVICGVLLVAALIVVFGSIVMENVSSSTSDPTPGVVDRVSSMNDRAIGSQGGTYFTIEGNIDSTYACYVDTDQSCATLAPGDEIEFTLTGGSRVSSIKIKSQAE